LTNLPGRPNLALGLHAEVVVGTLAVAAGLALVLVAAGDATSTLATTRRRRGRFWPTPVYYRWTWRTCWCSGCCCCRPRAAYRPELVAATELLLVPLEFATRRPGWTAAAQTDGSSAGPGAAIDSVPSSQRQRAA
jgi:hypothetical protein